MTKGTSFAEVKCLFEDLNNRLEQPIQTIYIDDCCTLRNKITSIFGPNVVVKVMQYRELQRLSRKHVQGPSLGVLYVVQETVKCRECPQFLHLMLFWKS